MSFRRYANPSRVFFNNFILLRSSCNLKHKIELGYYNHGYNIFTFIEKKTILNFMSQMRKLLLTFHGLLKQTFFAGPQEFVKTKFDFTSSTNTLLHHADVTKLYLLLVFCVNPVLFCWFLRVHYYQI